MKVYCSHCDTKYDDEFRLRLCPHETFAANDGANNFAHHPESFIEQKHCPRCGGKLQKIGDVLSCPRCDFYMPWGMAV